MEETFYDLIKTSDIYKQYHDAYSKAVHVPDEEKLLIDNASIYAQHYGLPTHYVDFTLDPEIAMFFACTKKDGDKWAPLSDEDIKSTPFGAIYIGWHKATYETDYKDSTVLSPTVLRRSFMQKGFLMPDDRIDTVDKIDFKHDVDFCEKIFKKLNEGKELFEHKGSRQVDEIINTIKNAKIYPFSIKTTVEEKYPKCIEIMKENGYEFGKNDDIEKINIDEIINKQSSATAIDPYCIFESIKNGEHSMDIMYNFLSGAQVCRDNFREAIKNLGNEGLTSLCMKSDN